MTNRNALEARLIKAAPALLADSVTEAFAARHNGPAWIYRSNVRTRIAALRTARAAAAAL